MEFLQKEDPSFHLTTDPDTGQYVISGMGELHLEIIQDRILNHYGVTATMGKIMIAYRTAIVYPVSGEFSTVDEKGNQVTMSVTVRPVERGLGNSFKLEKGLKRLRWPERKLATVIEAIEDGIKWGLMRGALGYPCLDTETTLDSCSINSENINLVAVRNCASQLVGRLVSTSKNPKLLEPVMKVEVLILCLHPETAVQFTTPAKFLGSLLSDITNVRRGNILEIITTEATDERLILADVPLKEMVGYSTTLRSMTAGSATFSMEFTRYDEMSEEQQEAILRGS